jgi:mannose-6-phosphate isomerase-like protein (cupin superfamily)
MRRRLTPILLLSLVLSACGARDESHVLQVEPATEVLAFSSEPLFRSPRVSAHRQVALAPLPAHFHRHSEENVYVVSGSGRMRVGDEWHELRAGSLVHVPKGVVHAFVPDGLITAVSIFSPPFNERDREFVVETDSPGGNKP